MEPAGLHRKESVPSHFCLQELWHLHEEWFLSSSSHNANASSSGSPRRLQQKRVNVSMRAHDGTQLHCVHASGIHSGTSLARPRFWNSDCLIGVSPPGLKELTGSASPDLVFRLFKNTSENSSGDLDYYVREGFAFFSDTSVSNAEPHDSGYSTLYRF